MDLQVRVVGKRVCCTFTALRNGLCQYDACACIVSPFLSFSVVPSSEDDEEELKRLASAAVSGQDIVGKGSLKKGLS